MTGLNPQFESKEQAPVLAFLALLLIIGRSLAQSSCLKLTKALRYASV